MEYIIGIIVGIIIGVNLKSSNKSNKSNKTSRFFKNLDTAIKKSKNKGL